MNNSISHLVIIFLATLLVTMGCQPKSAAKVSLPDQPAGHIYPAHGVVENISPDRTTATIRHDNIAGYMSAMTMDFPVRNTNELLGISTNDEITFNLVVQTNSDWIENVQFQSHHISEVTDNTFIFHTEEDELKNGDPLPDGELISEAGNRIKLSDFRGTALAFTFFFTSCPLPDYCPRMNRNFSEVRGLLDAATNTAGRWQLLSISFDPGFDQPAILSGYATFYRGQDTNHWLFCAAPTNTLAVLAPSVGLTIMRDTNGVAHNLRTVVVDPAGRIFQQFDGNHWTPRQLADAVLAAMAQTNSIQ